MESPESIIERGGIPEHGQGEPKKKSGKGCWFWGIIIFLVLVVGCSATAYFGVKKFMHGFVESFTSEEPLDLPISPLSAVEAEEFEKKVREFQSTLETDNKITEFEFTGEQLASFINKQTNGNILSRIKISDEQVHSELSLNLTPFGYSGKYFNGSASFKSGVIHGGLDIRVTKVTVNGSEFPDEFVKELGKRNIIEYYRDQAEFGEFLDKIEGQLKFAGVIGDKFVIVPK